MGATFQQKKVCDSILMFLILTTIYFWFKLSHKYRSSRPEVFYKKRRSKKFHKNDRKTPVPISFLIKLRPQACNLLKQKIWHRCFPVKLKRIPFLQNTSGRLFCKYFPLKCLHKSDKNHSQAAVRKCSSKQIFQKFSQISQKNTCIGVSF